MAVPTDNFEKMKRKQDIEEEGEDDDALTSQKKIETGEEQLAKLYKKISIPEDYFEKREKWQKLKEDKGIDDGLVYLDETVHKYYSKLWPNTIIYSASTLVKEKHYFPTERIITNILNGNNPYYQDCRAAEDPRKAILKKWNNAAFKGRKVHFIIESFFLNKLSQETMEDVAANYPNFLSQFEKILPFIMEKYVHLESEFPVVHRKYPVAGTIDGLFADRKTGEIVLIDWKTSNKSAKYILKHPNKSHKEQLNIYVWLLKDFHIPISKMYLYYFLEKEQDCVVVEVKKNPNINDFVMYTLQKAQAKEVQGNKVEIKSMEEMESMPLL